MKVQQMDRKLKHLAENMKDLRIEGTKIAGECLTTKERMLFDRIQEIIDTYGMNPPPDVLAENHMLFVKGIELLVRRSMDLFVNVFGKAWGGPIEEFFFKLCFSNFLIDFLEAMEKVRKWTSKERQRFIKEWNLDEHTTPT